MRKYGIMFATLFGCFSFIGWSSPAFAQAHACPQGPGPGEVFAGMAGGGNGIAPVQLCYYSESGGYSSYAPPPLPLPPPEPRRAFNTSGAVAWHPNSKEVWATWNQRNERLAQSLVVEACNATMGSGCTIAQWVTNGYIAVATDQKGELRSAAGESEAEAKSILAGHCGRSTVHCGDVKVFSSLPLSEPESYDAEDRARVDKLQVIQEYSYPAFSKVKPPKDERDPLAHVPANKRVGDAPKGHRLIHKGADGSWFQPARHPGQSCGMYYTSGDGDMLFWFGPSNGTNGAFGIVSKKIPKVKKQQAINIEIIAHNGTAKAQALQMPWQRGQSIIIIPAKMKETLDQTDDVASFQVRLDGNSVYSAEFSGNYKARDAMRACMAE